MHQSTYALKAPEIFDTLKITFVTFILCRLPDWWAWKLYTTSSRGDQADKVPSKNGWKKQEQKECKENECKHEEGNEEGKKFS